ncbi:MAG: Virginiamycin B lyase [Candidatus Eremiobacteraeota bacterium]|nr:Virginiamycin B lyase [Candidatus Eremiobacteraeota bacterium]
MTTAGVVTESLLPHAFSSPNVIVSGPDGALWFTENTHQSIGRMTVGGSLTEFPTSRSGTPFFITRGPDGSLWFAGDRINFNTAVLSRMTTSGNVCNFPDPTPGALLFGIASGHDGYLWFLDNRNNVIGRSDRSGKMNFFSIPTAHSSPYAITSGPDGNLWFTETVGDKIGRITPQGVITEFLLPSANRFPEGIAAGADGEVWFTEVGHIGRISAAGAITEFSAAPMTRPFVIAPGPPGDQHMWFTDPFGGAIGSIHL